MLNRKTIINHEKPWAVGDLISGYPIVSDNVSATLEQHFEQAFGKTSVKFGSWRPKAIGSFDLP